MLIASAGAVGFIAQWEGFRGRTYTPVPGDVATCGFGTTKDCPTEGRAIDPVTALTRLTVDIGAKSKELGKCLPSVPLHQHEADAFVSLAYNVGAGAVCKNKDGKPTRIVRSLMVGDYKGACEAIGGYVYFKGTKLPGLEKRRAAEVAKCLGG